MHLNHGLHSGGLATRPQVPEPAPWRVCAGSNCRVFRLVDRDVRIAISLTRNRAGTARSTFALAHGRITLRVSREANGVQRDDGR